MVAIVRYTDKGFVTKMKSSVFNTNIFMSEVLYHMEPIFNSIKGRRYINGTRPRFYLRIAMSSISKSSSLSINLIGDNGNMVIRSITHRRLKDVHSVVNFIQKELVQTGWIRHARS